ncbi:MAG: ribonuclease HII [Chlamydiales bacterium]
METEIIAGVDEAGRGPLAGPVVASAVCILGQNHVIEGIADSKTLDPLRRQQIYEAMLKHPQFIIAVSVVDVALIDQINILQATLLAMKQAIEKLSIQPSKVLVDGPHVPDVSIPCEGIIGGDGLHECIAAASIIAKVHRDTLMENYHEKWPEYGFNKHKGYATVFHREVLSKLGPCDIHRKSFKLSGTAKIESA